MRNSGIGIINYKNFLKSIRYEDCEERVNESATQSVTSEQAAIQSVSQVAEQ